MIFPVADLIATLGGLVIPQAWDFIKKKFIPQENDTPERTIGTLATTKPEALEGYVKGMVELIKAKVDFFNRDVVGQPSLWVTDIRAVIRPLGVIAAFIILGAMAYAYLFHHEQMRAVESVDVAKDTLLGIRLSCEAMLSSWFGDRIRLRGE